MCGGRMGDGVFFLYYWCFGVLEGGMELLVEVRYPGILARGVLDALWSDSVMDELTDVTCDT